MGKHLAAVAMAAATVFTSLHGRAQTSSAALEEHAIIAAETPGDHAALAAHFRAKALEARASAARHRSLARGYGGKQGTGTPNFHCRRLAERAASNASEYEALANLHDAASRER